GRPARPAGRRRGKERVRPGESPGPVGRSERTAGTGAAPGERGGQLHQRGNSGGGRRLAGALSSAFKNVETGLLLSASDGRIDTQRLMPRKTGLARAEWLSRLAGWGVRTHGQV